MKASEYEYLFLMPEHFRDGLKNKDWVKVLKLSEKLQQFLDGRTTKTQFTAVELRLLQRIQIALRVCMPLVEMEKNRLSDILDNMTMKKDGLIAYGEAEHW
ncbi:hypothetical protein [Chromobacterium amazonense]|uniref:hypothetical protein n=1 Tax=Chromobacterium amazonense TaxID=1382803 RepID=UPI0031F65174